MPQDELLEARLTHSVIGAFFEVCRHLKFGLLETLYAAALERELVERGHRVAREARVNVYYKGELLGIQRLDMVVDEKLVIEIKSTLVLHPDAWRQIYGYLFATKLEVGLLLHFSQKPNFHRVVCTNKSHYA